MLARCLVVPVLVLLAAGGARADVSVHDDLLNYVKRGEPDFAWKVKSRREVNGAKLYDLELVSQKWQGILWDHDLCVVVPPKVEPTATMFLYNTGGKPNLLTREMALDLAIKMEAPVAFLYGIPKQPLFNNLKEDALIAETFVRYLDTKDASWPLLFPMTKSLVKAMDALQAFARQEWKAEVKQFVVAGGSKRGWTTWLTAAADPRVKAIIPIVIDTLNMQKQMAHQLESYGAYSRMIHDYTERKLVPMPDTPEAKKLWLMVDPWAYRNRVTMPKLILNGTNDPYWTQDALNLYWDDLSGQKWICYVPNAGHDLTEKDKDGKPTRLRAGQAIGAFAKAQIHDKPLPKMAWKHQSNGDKHQVRVTSDQEPKAARLWVADAATKDFRKAAWKEAEAKVEKGVVTAQTETPAAGCRVYFVECEYDVAGLPYYLSTQLRIVGKPKKE